MSPSPIRVGLDAHMIGAHETGNETYVRGLLAGFARVDGAPALTVYTARGTRDLDLPAGAQQHRLAATNPLWRLGLELPLRARRERLDVLHVTYAGPPWGRVPLVATVHDVSFRNHPEWFSRRDRLVLTAGVGRTVRRAARIITVSEFARREIIEHYRLPQERVVAIPEAAGPAGARVDPGTARNALRAVGIDPGRPYLLAVGTLQPRKNLPRLFDAYAALRASGEFDGDLVVAGPPGYGADHLHRAGGVRLTGYVDDRTLAALFKLSHGFVMPSLYEAFGLPVVEAMSHGVPVACSTGGALPDVCGGAALMFDPTDTDAMAAALTTLVSDSITRQRLIDSGLARAGELDWAATAAATMQVYREAAAS